MPVILFKLRNVPDDEAEEVRELLSRHKLDFYETPAGRWGISMEAIWLKDESQYDEAKQLLDEYQEQRSRKFQKEYQQLKEQGGAESFIQRILGRPVQSIFYLGFILVILYFVTVPFFKLAMD